MPEPGTFRAVQSEEPSAAFGVARIGEAFVGISIDFLSEVCQVSALRQMMIRSPYLTGGFDLRGHLIPIINLTRICGFDDPVDRPKFAVILRRADQLLAFLVDEVTGITQTRLSDVQSLQHTDGQVCVTGVFLDRDRLISVADIDAIFDLPGIFTVKVPHVAQTLTADAERVPMLIFDVGGAQVSVGAVDIYGTVPRQTIEVNSMTSGFCLGAITYHQRRVPVLNTVDLLGIGRRVERPSSEVVILRGANDQVLGLAVDAIQDIRRMDPRRLAAIPGAIARQSNFLTGVHVNEDGSQIYALAAERMLMDPAVAAMASLSSPAPNLAGMAADDRQIAGNTRRVSERYLIFQVGRAMAVPLDQVTCIIAPPKNLIPATAAWDGLIGYFPRARESVPLVDLSAHLGLPPVASDMARVLLTGNGASQVGFQVERIFGIETSSWVLTGMTVDGPGSDRLVQLGSAESKRVLPTIDLDEIAAQSFAAAAPQPDIAFST